MIENSPFLEGVFPPDSLPLLHSHEAPPGALRSALGPPAQGGHGPVGVSPEEGYKVDQRPETPFLQRELKSVGVVQPGKEKALGRPYSSLLVPKGGLQESWRTLCQ